MRTDSQAGRQAHKTNIGVLVMLQTAPTYNILTKILRTASCTDITRSNQCNVKTRKAKKQCNMGIAESEIRTWEKKEITFETTNQECSFYTVSLIHDHNTIVSHLVLRCNKEASNINMYNIFFF